MQESLTITALYDTLLEKLQFALIGGMFTICLPEVLSLTPSPGTNQPFSLYQKIATSACTDSMLLCHVTGTLAKRQGSAEKQDESAHNNAAFELWCVAAHKYRPCPSPHPDRDPDYHPPHTPIPKVYDVICGENADTKDGTATLTYGTSDLLFIMPA